MKKILASLMVLIALAAVSGWAAPLDGFLQLDVVTRSATCGVDQDADGFVDEDPANGLDDDNDAQIDEDGCTKVDLAPLKAELDLVLRLTISGLQVKSISVFSFRGFESQAFEVGATVGPLGLTSVIVFARSITEIEVTRTSTTLDARYCVRQEVPGDVTPPLLPCPLVDSRLWWLLEDVGVYHPAVATLTLAQIFDAGGMLDDDATLRKKATRLVLPIGGLKVDLNLLLADLRGWRLGLVMGLEGQTVSGLVARFETWLGARQGVECFAECKPLQRLYGGIVVEELEFQQEKLFVRNISFGGVVSDLYAEMRFFVDDPTLPLYCEGDVICLVELHSRAAVRPPAVEVENLLRLGPGLSARFNRLSVRVRIGEIAATAHWNFYLTTGSWQVQLAELIGVFDPPGLRLTSELKFCTGISLVLCTGEFLKHTIVLEAELGGWRMRVKLLFIGLLKHFHETWFDGSWRLGGVELESAVVMKEIHVQALSVGVRLSF